MNKVLQMPIVHVDVTRPGFAMIVGPGFTGCASRQEDGRLVVELTETDDPDVGAKVTDPGGVIGAAKSWTFADAGHKLARLHNLTTYTVEVEIE